MLPAKLAISYMNIFTFKRTLKFWAIGCMSRALSLPPTAPGARSELGGGGGRDMAGPIFLL